MDIEKAQLFQEKIDEVLKDTEEFVNATKQLTTVRRDLNAYINKSGEINSKLNTIAKELSDSVKYATQFFNGDFTEDIYALIREINATVDGFSAQAEKLKTQYDEILNSDNYVELQMDHSNILDSIDEVRRLGEEIKEEQKNQTEKIDYVIELLKNHVASEI